MKNKVLSVRVPMDDYLDFLEEAISQGITMNDWLLLKIYRQSGLKKNQKFDKESLNYVRDTQKKVSKAKPKPTTVKKVSKAKPKPTTVKKVSVKKPKTKSWIKRRISFSSMAKAITATGASFKRRRIDINDSEISIDDKFKIFRKGRDTYHLFYKL